MKVLGKSWITKDLTLWGTVILTILIFVAIQLAASHSELTLLDSIASPSKAREILSQMQPNQKNAHIWITATLDVAFPLSYGSLLAGSALRFFPKYGIYLAVPALLAIFADLSEGIIQILALTDIYTLLWLKQYVTPFKFAMVILGLIIAVIGLGIRLMNWSRNRTKNT